MYTIRIIPCLDVKEGKVVKGIHFKNLRYAGDPVELAKWYSDEGADEIVFLDITATIEKRQILLDVVKRTAQNVFVPLTVGGGVKSLDDIRDLLNSGADKVAINTAAVKNPDFVKQAAKMFGSQCIVVAIDAKLVHGSQFTVHSSRFTVHSSRSKVESKKWEVYINAGSTPTGLDAVFWARKVEKLGAGEILLTSIDADGTNQGYDVELTKAVVDAVNIPVIASGGAGKIEHFIEVVKKAKVSAVLAASVFHYKKYSIKKVKTAMNSAGIQVRV
ncbi:MAG: imidazole glycerol phosphate synthase subunit HisF [Endomicrobia bacterium]|nr:imidazole glycerol phosphate synthase subunit HisF [Endomicrobiia bacterium]MDW8055690.1 imidazole glycerol phosphate synthase subunit HisF [Elusimicrobiota bacterium]